MGERLEVLDSQSQESTFESCHFEISFHLKFRDAGCQPVNLMRTHPSV
jgi:hypothetical protein